MTWVGIACALYLLLGLAIYLLQDRLIFPRAGLGDRAFEKQAGVTTEALKRPGGESFRIAVGSVENATAVMVFCVGNGEDLSSCVRWAGLWRNYGVEAVVVEYPGFGLSEGEPGVASFFEAASAAADFAVLRAKKKGLPFVVGGNSIGAFSAVNLAVEKARARVLLFAPPSALASIGASRFWWLPVRYLLRHKFDSLAAAPKVTCPVYVMHGDQDSIVPQRYGKQLAGLFSGPVEFVSAIGHGHNDLPVQRLGAYGEGIAAFLAGR